MKKKEEGLNSERVTGYYIYTLFFKHRFALSQLFLTESKFDLTAVIFFINDRSYPSQFAASSQRHLQ